MYLYLYASFLRSRKYQRVLSEIEGRVTDFGLSGKIIQLSQFLKFSAAVREYGLRKIGTLVVVGDDALLEEAAGLLASSPVEVLIGRQLSPVRVISRQGIVKSSGSVTALPVLGFIPVGERQSRIAHPLGIPEGVAACETLAARRITKLDLGRVNTHFFIHALSVSGRNLELHCPTFSIFPKGLAKIEVINLDDGADAEDGKLNVRILPIEGRFRAKLGTPTQTTVISCRLKALKPLLVNGANAVLKLPLQVDIMPKAFRMIVGRRMQRGLLPNALSSRNRSCASEAKVKNRRNIQSIFRDFLPSRSRAGAIAVEMVFGNRPQR